MFLWPLAAWRSRRGMGDFIAGVTAPMWHDAPRRGHPAGCRFLSCSRRTHEAERRATLGRWFLLKSPTEGALMNLILTCKCGQKFRVTLERDGQDVVCPGCGRVKKVSAPLPIVPARVEEEVKLQEIDVATPAVQK